MLRIRCAVIALLLSTVLFQSNSLSQTVDKSKPHAPSPAVSTSEKPIPITPSQSAHPLEKVDLEAFFDGILPIQLERADIAGATVLVMKDGQLLLKKGYGYSDLSKKKLVDPDSSMFRLASISKLFTWISVMQLVEQGKLNIDTDVNQYLDFQIKPAFGKPITLRNLMTHTGGFEEESRDILLTDPKQAPALRDFLITNQPRRIFPPGEIPAYSNYGVGVAGYIVQRVSGQSFEQYVNDHIFEPLSMTHSSFHQPLQDSLVPSVSEGYNTSTEKPVVGFEIFNPAPAGGVSSSASDMGRLAQALLNGGEVDGHRILKTETLNLMWTRQFAASDQLPAICMGFYQTWRNGLHFIGHDGDLIAFHSMFIVEPAEKLAIFISYNSAGSASKTRSEILNNFADRYYPYAPSPQFQNLPLKELKAIEGTYQSTRRAESTKVKLLQLGSQTKVSVDKEGVLKLDISKDLRGHIRKWKPLTKDLWQVDGDQPRLFTIRDDQGKIIRIATNFAGTQFERVPWYENSSLVLPFLLSSLVILLLVVSATVIRLGRRIFFSSRAPFREQPKTRWISTGPRLAAFAWITVLVVFVIIMTATDIDNTPPGHVFDKYFVFINILTAFAVFASLFAILPGITIWLPANLRFISRLKFSLVTLACLFLVWFSLHWHLLGPAYRY